MKAYVLRSYGSPAWYPNEPASPPGANIHTAMNIKPN